MNSTPNLATYAAPEACAGHWMIRSCKCGKKPVWAGGCGKRSCPLCGISKSRASADRIFQRIGGVPRVQTTILTVPEGMRYAFRRDARLWTAAVKSWIHEAKEAFGLIWAYCRTHPCGEDGERFNPHANILWGRGPGFRGEIDVARMRDVWNRSLGRDPRRTVNVKTAFIVLKSRKGVAQLNHWLRYMERGFPGWTWAGLWGRWYGSYPKKLDSTPVRRDHRCIRCGHPVEWLTPSQGERDRLGKVETRLLSGAPPEPKHVDLCLAAVVKND